MKAALVIGKHNSTGLPGKNFRKILGRPMVEYPLMAAYHCNRLQEIFVSTDSPIIKEIAATYNATIIDRPAQLAQTETPTEIVFQHAYEYIKKVIGPVNQLSLMFANSPDVLPVLLDQAFDMLDSDTTLDSVVSVSKYNMFTPLRARKVMPDNTTEPLLDLNSFGISNTFDRDALGDVYFCDFGVQIVRPERCLVNVHAGSLPFTWLGERQGALIKDYGFDIDYEWQIPVIEHWLRVHGFTEKTTPYK